MLEKLKTLHLREPVMLAYSIALVADAGVKALVGQHILTVPGGVVAGLGAAVSLLARAKVTSPATIGAAVVEWGPLAARLADELESPVQKDDLEALIPAAEGGRAPVVTASASPAVAIPVFHQDPPASVTPPVV